jgi:hypothetical protein
LLLNPIGVGGAALFGSRLAAAVVMNASAGALAVVLAWAFLRRLGAKSLYAVLFAVLFGVSSSQLFFASAPETWSFSAVGVVALFFLAAVRPGSWAWALPAGVFAVGMATHNVGPAAAAFAAGLASNFSPRAVIARTGVYLLTLVASVAALSIVQKILYPGTVLFFLPEVYVREFGTYAPIVGKIGGLTATDVLARLGELGGHFFLASVVAPQIVVKWFSAGEYSLPLKPFVDVAPGRFTAVGYVAATLWVVLFVWAVVSFVRHRLARSALAWGLVATLAFNFVLFFFYGSCLFIYSVSVTFPLIAAVALALRPYDRRSKAGYLLAAGGAAWVGLVLVNNVGFLTKIWAVYNAYPYPLVP